MSLPIIYRYSPNFFKLTLPNQTLWFSYNTLIAFKIGSREQVIHENIWGNTTGNHLNQINPDKDLRVDKETFKKLWEMYSRI